MNKDSQKLFITVIIMSLIGIVMIYSASSIWSLYKYNDSFHFVKYQLLFMILGIIAIFIISKYNYLNYKKKAGLIIITSLILLALVLVPGIGMQRNGSRSWFNLGAFAFQPSEFAKIALIIFFAKYLEKYNLEITLKNKNLYPILLTILIFFGLIMLEPDLGSGMVIVLSLLLMIFASGVKLSFFGFLGVLGLIGFSFLIIMAPYRVQRILSFLNPWSDPLGSGYQIIQSLYAIGPAGLFGLGFGKSIQKQFYLPEPQTDFIFAIISEEFGIIGVIIITFLFGYLYYQIIRIVIKHNDLFGKFLAFGLGSQIMLQTLLNLCVVVGLIPVTGVTLPFFSYGGSSLLISMISIGIIINISQNNRS